MKSENSNPSLYCSSGVHANQDSPKFLPKNGQQEKEEEEFCQHFHARVECLSLAGIQNGTEKFVRKSSLLYRLVRIFLAGFPLLSGADSRLRLDSLSLSSASFRIGYPARQRVSEMFPTLDGIPHTKHSRPHSLLFFFLFC